MTVLTCGRDVVKNYMLFFLQGPNLRTHGPFCVLFFFVCFVCFVILHKETAKIRNKPIEMTPQLRVRKMDP